MRVRVRVRRSLAEEDHDRRLHFPAHHQGANSIYLKGDGECACSGVPPTFWFWCPGLTEPSLPFPPPAGTPAGCPNKCAKEVLSVALCDVGFVV